MSTATETLARVQDALCERLTAGRIMGAEMPAAFADHVTALTAAGFNEHEARACFWDAVATARHITAKPEPIAADGIYTVADASRVLGMHQVTIREKLRCGIIRGSRRLGQWRVRGSELLKTA